MLVRRRVTCTIVILMSRLKFSHTAFFKTQCQILNTTNSHDSMTILTHFILEKSKRSFDPHGSNKITVRQTRISANQIKKNTCHRLGLMNGNWTNRRRTVFIDLHVGRSMRVCVFCTANIISTQLHTHTHPCTCTHTLLSIIKYSFESAKHY